ncbi:MAG: phosphate signaling complex protein PhoU [Candidatus Cloacimonetes bacterium]|nr:phosphate signaling complex protein PhoU [Candidatus Cloacimonadota bacterium]
MLNERIADLMKMILDVARLVETMLDLSVQGLLDRDKDKLEKVFELEEKVNQYEIDIEEECVALIALQQPEAKNLRTVLMILKMNNDLERMGDHTCSIVKSALFLISKPFIKKFINIPIMAEETKKMLDNTITAFINEDAELARQVCINDEVVDDLREQIYRVLVTYVVDDPTTIKRAFNINKIAANLERIADLSTNIAEDTIFICEGKIIKHHASE